MSLALKSDPQNALFLLQKLNPIHKIHGFCISMSWLPPSECATPLLSMDYFFVHFDSFVEHSKAKGTCGHFDVPQNSKFYVRLREGGPGDACMWHHNPIRKIHCFLLPK